MMIPLRALASCLLAFAAGAAGAATYYVDIYNDDPTKDGCLTLIPDDCSLRGAVLKANAHAGTDTIQLAGPVQYILTVVGDNEDGAQTGDLDLLEDVTIRGAGAGISTVWQMAPDRVFEVHAGVVAFFQRLTIRGGNETIGQGGGGIRNWGTATILQRAEVLENTTAGSGGGINSTGPSLWLQQSHVGSNHAAFHGGGIHVAGSGAALTIEESSIAGNSIDDSYGGGLYAVYTNGVLRNSTLSANDAAGQTSPIDGIFLVESTLTLESCTLGGQNPVLRLLNSSVTLRSTLIDGACAYYDPGSSSIVPDRGNVESPGDTCNLDDYSDLKNVPDSEIGPLHRWGGHTWAHRPYVSSPAVDYLYATQRCQPYDQRGVERPQGLEPGQTPHCDAGAVELARDELFLHGFEFGTWVGWSSVGVP